MQKYSNPAALVAISHRVLLPTSLLVAPAPAGLRVVVVAELRDCAPDVFRAADQSEEAGSRDRKGVALQLKHNPRDGHHLKSCRDFSAPSGVDLQGAVQVFENDTAEENDGIPCDDEDRKPEGKLDRPAADAERDDG